MSTRRARGFCPIAGKLGWTPGQNIEISYRWGAGDDGRMTANAREMVALAPEVIVTKGANLPSLAAGLAPNIPIVFVLLSDAQVHRYIASLARPGGNIAGFTSGERLLVGKRLQLLREIDPAITRALYVRGQHAGPDLDGLFERLAADATASGFIVNDSRVQAAAENEPLIASFAQEPNASLPLRVSRQHIARCSWNSPHVPASRRLSFPVR